MKRPAFDEDGYPTEATLKEIETWDYKDIKGLINYVIQAWQWGSNFCDIPRSGIWTMSTGGWSGNESILSALESNYMVQATTTSIYVRGGLYCVAFNKNGDKEIDELFDYITKWAWREAK